MGTNQFAPILISLIGGFLPAFFWLWFWLKEDELHPEPRHLIFLCFLGGMLSIPIAVFFQGIINSHFPEMSKTAVILCVIAEELCKFLAALSVALLSKDDNEPVDPIIYMITVALGFAAMENSLFVYKTLAEGSVAGGMITANMRFMGATLLHVLSSAAIGASLAFSFYKTEAKKIAYFLGGLTIAVILHSLFNLFIIRGDGQNTFSIFSLVWFSVIVLLVMFEKVKSIYPLKKT